MATEETNKKHKKGIDNGLTKSLNINILSQNFRQKSH